MHRTIWELQALVLMEPPIMWLACTNSVIGDWHRCFVHLTVLFCRVMKSINWVVSYSSSHNRQHVLYAWMSLSKCHLRAVKTVSWYVAPGFSWLICITLAMFWRSCLPVILIVITQVPAWLASNVFARLGVLYLFHSNVKQAETQMSVTCQFFWPSLTRRYLICRESSLLSHIHGDRDFGFRYRFQCNAHPQCSAKLVSLIHMNCHRQNFLSRTNAKTSSFGSKKKTPQ